MATSTMFTFLMHKASSAASYTKLVDIKEFPDLGGTPDLIDATTLSDTIEKKVLGVQSLGDGLAFTANYDPDDYSTVKALEDGASHDFAVYYGGTKGPDGTVTPTGSAGKFTFSGTLSAYAKGGGTNAVRDIGITIAPTSEIVFSDGSGS